LLSIDCKLSAVWAGLVVMLTPNLTPTMSKVWIEKKGASLRLRWMYAGKRVQIALGVKDTPTGKAFANQQRATIEMDLVSGNYDPTLLKYKPRKLGKNHTQIGVVELLNKYLDYREKEGCISSREHSRLLNIATKLGRLLGDEPPDRIIEAEKLTESLVKNVVARWAETASDRTIKSYLYHFKACWDWAKDKYHIIDPNPWAVSLDRAKQRGNRTPSKPKHPFTIAELQAIVTAFANHPRYQHYTDFVVFLAQSACRPGEAAGLRWKSIATDGSTAWIGESISRGHRNRQGTKTGKSRTIQLTPTVRSILTSRRERLNPQPDELVFPSPKGLSIDDHNFNNRVWKSILASCQINYRSPYNLRHSAISHALHSGVNPIDLAEQTGHDKRVMLSTYAHAIGNDCPFVDFHAPSADESSL
jgi:integrase